MWIRQNDVVQVIAGDDRGTVGKVLRVMRDENRVIVEGVNRSYKHVKPSQRNPRGGRVLKELPINLSNVLLFDATLGRGVRVGVKINEAGDKVRYCRKTGREMGVIAPARVRRTAQKSGS